MDELLSILTRIHFKSSPQTTSLQKDNTEINFKKKEEQCIQGGGQAGDLMFFFNHGQRKTKEEWGRDIGLMVG